MSNIKVVKINNIPEPSKKTKKKSSNDLDYLKNIIRAKPVETKESNKMKKNKETEDLLLKENP